MKFAHLCEKNAAENRRRCFVRPVPSSSEAHHVTIARSSLSVLCCVCAVLFSKVLLGLSREHAELVWGAGNRPTANGGDVRGCSRRRAQGAR